MSSALSLSLLSGACPAMAQTAANAASPQQKTYNIDIPSLPLSKALAQLSLQTDLEIVYTQDEPYDVTAPAVKGRYTSAQALQILLQGSGFTARQVRSGVVTLEKTQGGISSGANSFNLGAIRVEGTGVAENPSGLTEREVIGHDDIYDQDFSTVYADRRTVERYKGVSSADILKGLVGVYSRDVRNSGALDPSIRGISGASRVPVIIDGTEQALAVNRGYNGVSNRSYLDPNLIAGVQVFKGPNASRDVRGGNYGAVTLNTLSADDILTADQTFGMELKIEGGNNVTSPRLPTLLTGQDYRTVPGFPGSPGVSGSPATPKGDPSLKVVPRDNKNLLSLGDRAVRVAVAGKTERFDWLAAFAYRTAGNYYVGSEQADYYNNPDYVNSVFTLIRRLATDYAPGREAPNTSSELTSYLVKGKWRISDDQSLQLTLRDSQSDYGEVMPSRIVSAEGFGTSQWPLSSVHAKAGTLEYRWRPDSQWIDLKASLWTTRTQSATYSAGGYPNMAGGASDPILRNTALTNAQNNRTGISFSNRFQPLQSLDLTLAGNWQKEKISSPDTYNASQLNGWMQYPRAGRREEYDLSLYLDWRPNQFLTVNAGARYSSYWAFDDFLQSQLDAGNGSRFNQYVPTSYTVTYQTEHTGPDAWIEYYRSLYVGGLPPAIQAIWESQIRATWSMGSYTLDRTAPAWLPGEDGRFLRADNACVNGWLNDIADYNGRCSTTAVNTIYQPVNHKKKADGWAPWLGLTLHFTGNSRVYLRYDEAYRYPTIGESTVSFATSVNPRGPLKPEHIHAYEVAYVHDLRDILKLDSDQRADIKLTWFRTETDDVIERDVNLMYSNLEQQVIEGLEFQARYDNGRFFTDFSAAHTLKNKVCDAEVAILLQPGAGTVPDCVNYGFVSGYLLAQATPDYSANWTFGGRFLDRRLEAGGRLVYYSKYDNAELDLFIGNPLNPNVVGGYALNTPYTWGRILTADAYVSYVVNDKIKLELVGTNLTDRYYIDPLSRSLMPAPGRAVRFSLTARY
ncbi:MAG: TonB-dependent receptor [Asticcacaulis sp.]